MPEEKKYGYARDIADIDDPGQIPTEVTGNAIELFLRDLPGELEPGQDLTGPAIRNHDYILDTYSTTDQVVVKGDLDDFDADLRDNVADASGSIEDSELPELEPTNPSHS